MYSQEQKQRSFYDDYENDCIDCGMPSRSCREKLLNFVSKLRSWR